jgi:hypothetical protein
MKHFGVFRVAVIVAGMLVLASCATQPLPDADDAPGFFSGYWHGLTIIFALIWHLFDNSVRIYAFPNSGGWYDFGFLLGAASALGGGTSAASQQRGQARSRIGPQ